MLGSGPYPLAGPRFEANGFRNEQMVVGLDMRGISPTRVRVAPGIGPPPQLGPLLQPKIALPQPTLAVSPAAVQLGLSARVAPGTLQGPPHGSSVAVTVPDSMSRLGAEVQPRPVPTTRSPLSSVSWHPLLQSASEEALAMYRSASFAVPERRRASPPKGQPSSSQTPPAGYRSPHSGQLHFPKASSFISLRTVNENSKHLEAEDWPRRQPPNRGVRVEPPTTSPRTGGTKPRPPPLQLSTSLTTPPSELPSMLSAEYEEEGEVIGEGAFAVVRRLRHKRTQSLVALKVVEKYPLQIRNMIPQLCREVRIQGGLQHPHILRLLSCVEDDRYVYMLLEHCPGGSLRSLCARQPYKRLSEATAARYFAQILQGVEFMHRKCYVHRDLKEENMLLTSQDEVRICDFGWSAEVQAENALLTTCGTPHYWPPEIFEGETQDTAVDLWALGTLVYELLIGHWPFWGSTEEELRQKVLSVDLRYPSNLLTNEAIAVFKGLLRRDPRRRTPARELLEGSPWVTRAVEGKAQCEGSRSRKAFTPPPPRLGASMIDTTASRVREVRTEKLSDRQPAVQAVRSGPLLSQLPAQVVAPIIRPPPDQAQAAPGPLSAALPNSMSSMFIQQEPWMPPMGMEAAFRQGPLIPRPCVQAPMLPLQHSKILPAPPALRFLAPAGSPPLGTAR